MIYTVTLNPSIDYVVEVNELTAGEIMRTKAEDLIFGGKGINVSSMLAQLGMKSCALGFIAGFYRGCTGTGGCGHGHSAGFSEGGAGLYENQRKGACAGGK